MTATISGLQNEILLKQGLLSVVKIEEPDLEDSVLAEGLKHVTKSPFIIQAGTSGELLRCVASQQSNDEGQETLQHWEVQWHEPRAPEVISASSPAWGNLQVPQLTLADDIEVYLSTFERVADACQWPRDQWVARLVPALSGAAQQAYTSLSMRDREDYGKVKAAILCHCSVGSETRRQRFRRFCFQEAEGPRQACGNLRELCCQWLKPEIHTKDHILELLILEQFLTILPEEMQSWVWDCRPETCAQAVDLAEEFVLKQQEAEKSDAHVIVDMKVEGEPSGEEEEEMALAGALWDVPGPQTSPGCPSQNAVESRGPIEPPCELTCILREEAEPSQEIAGAGTTSQTTECPPENSLEMSRQSWRNMDEGTSSDWEEDKHLGERDGSSEDELGLQRRRLRKRPAVLPSQTSRAKETLQETNDQASQARAFFWGEKPHQFEECGESFRAKQELALRKGIHRWERPFPCAVCGKRFTRLYHLTTHLRIHSGEKPYRCAECGKSFGDLSNCYKHQRRHRGDRPYVCDACGDSFSKQKELLAHRRTHENGRVPSVC
ncbi:zinc finger and SCAN domain-containing protein 23-like [Sceloporus undulatus]|uniref:zinc finger and SCAN domain-containing protein 23-like n=1 Tax=Sceloporus undulatus TaxID=8520 RepID=UPI001C4A7C6C|nr:zinc finger and SCAN domain-containing protein 23-like [Sceloporus undulatus]XP_042333527.1 zinc finger and SCAN domain-containing protein 23-like [Sceloporus undulatus]XP_042333528.1 zinc finger and SCAN domain-containing protein 23-like [Sceloporus undulatus]